MGLTWRDSFRRKKAGERMKRTKLHAELDMLLAMAIKLDDKFRPTKNAPEVMNLCGILVKREK